MVTLKQPNWSNSPPKRPKRPKPLKMANNQHKRPAVCTSWKGATHLLWAVRIHENYPVALKHNMSPRHGMVFLFTKQLSSATVIYGSTHTKGGLRVV